MEEILYKNEVYTIQGAIFDVYRAQVFNYLKATGIRLGLLVNFGNYPKVAIERIVL